MGNIKSIQHGTAFTRHFDVDTNNNKVNQIDNGGATVYGSFLYDNNGNMTSSSATRNYEWDHSDQLRAYYNQTGTSEPSVYAHYLYDAGGNRVKKLVRTQGGDYTTAVYIDGLFEHHKKVGASNWERTYIHIMDDKSRIAVLRTGDNTDDISEDIFYNLEDHLGSSSTRLTTTGTKIDLEEYYPFGDSSLRTFSKKRYRYTGKEKDSESGLYYYGARYYAAWTGRFISTDPLSAKAPNKTPYHYTSNNPINRIDPTGKQDESKDDGKKETTLPEVEIVHMSGIKFEGAENINWLGSEMTKEMQQKLKYHYERIVNFKQNAPEHGPGRKIAEAAYNRLKEAYLSNDIDKLSEVLNSYHNFYSKEGVAFGIFIEELKGGSASGEFGIMKIDFVMMENPNFVQGEARTSASFIVHTKNLQFNVTSASVAAGISIIEGEVKGDFEEDLLSKVTNVFFQEMEGSVEYSIAGFHMSGSEFTIPLFGGVAGVSYKGGETVGDVTFHNSFSFSIGRRWSPFKNSDKVEGTKNFSVEILRESWRKIPTQQDTINSRIIRQY